MHEFAMCENVGRAALEEYAKLEPPPKRLVRIRVVAGGMHQIVPDFFTFAYEVLTKETAIEGSTMDLKVTPVIGRCRNCTWEGELTLPFFECGSCKERKIDVIHGMEMMVEKLEIEQA